MLELDIVLGRFVDCYFDTLDESQFAAFEALLDMPDAELWDMIMGRTASGQTEFAGVLELIKAA